MNRELFVPAGERRRLLPKEMTYVFSLEFVLELVTGRGPGPLVLESSGEWSTYHVTDREFVTTADGALRDVPKARLARAQDYLPSSTGVVNLRGHLLFKTDANASLSMDYSGVLNVPGGTSRWCDPSKPARTATAFIQSRQEHVGAKYRWLVWNQLVGIGEARPEEDRRRFAFSYDFYIAS